MFMENNGGSNHETSLKPVGGLLECKLERCLAGRNLHERNSDASLAAEGKLPRAQQVDLQASNGGTSSKGEELLNTTKEMPQEAREGFPTKQWGNFLGKNGRVPGW